MADSAVLPTENLKKLPQSMRIFSLTLRSLYAEKAVSGRTAETREINRLRDDTRRDAKTYANAVLPACTDVVGAMKDYFQNYQVLDFEEWKDELPEIIEEVEGSIQVCQVAVELHKSILVPLKKRQDTAKVLLTKVDNLQSKYEKEMAELEDEAVDSFWWALSLCYIPGLRDLVVPVLLQSHQQMSRAISSGKKAELNNAAAFAIRDALIPALTNFIDGLEGICGFFNVIKEELKSFQKTGTKAVDKKRRTHYKIMKEGAKEITSGCQLFFSVIPAMKTDLAAIPEDGSDRYAIEQWIKQERRKIDAMYPPSETSSDLKKMLKSLDAEVRKLAIA